MSPITSASGDRSGFAARTAPALHSYVIGSIFVATACLAPAGAVDRARADSDRAAHGTLAIGAGPGDTAFERWGTFLVGPAFDGVHEAGPAGAGTSGATRLGQPFPSGASGMAARPASPYLIAPSDPARTVRAGPISQPTLTAGGRFLPAEEVSPRSTGTARPPWGAISELRAGVLNHDVIFPNRSILRPPNPFRQRMEGGVNLNGEVIFVSPGFLRYVGSPRPRLGGSLNARGYTDNAYLDLDWDHQFRAGPFLEGYLGLAWHDGKLMTGNPERLELGLRVLFHLGLEAGWRFYRHHGVSLIWEHMSNSTLASRNQGLDSIGLRYGYRFDVR